MPAKKRHPDELGRALAVARMLRGWQQQDLAEASGVGGPAISDYERAVKLPEMPTLERLAAALGFSVAELLELSALIRRRGPGGPAWTEPAEPGGQPWGRPELARAVAELLRADAAEAAQRSQPSEAARLLAEDRLLARALWARLADRTEEERQALLRKDAAFHTAGLVELLCEESVHAVGDSVQRARRLAELAVEVAERVPGEEAWRCRIQGYARPHLANAMRAGGNLQMADGEFERAAELWRAGAAADPGLLLNEARVLGLEAALRRDGHRLPEAVALFDRALEIDRWGETPGLLIGKAKALEGLGRFEEAVILLRQAGARLDAEDEPRKVWIVRALLLLNLCHLGRHLEAELTIGEVRALARQLGNQLDVVRVDWLEGRIAAGLGRYEEAIGLLERVRRKFVEDEMAYDGALVTLELAEIHATLGHREEVRALARESAPIFTQQGVHAEAQRALELFRRAVEDERLTVELVRAVIVYLYRARHDPRLRFERSR